MNTTPKMNQTKKDENQNKIGNPHYNTETKVFDVTKVTKLRMYFGCNYQKRIVKETGDTNFVPQECRVGKRVEKSCVYYNEKLDRYYFQYEQFDEVKPQTEFFKNGVQMNEIEIEIMRGFFPPYRPSTINFRLVNIENINRLHINKVQYVLKEEVEV